MQSIKDSWIETSVSIVSDAWKDASNCPLVNVIAVSTRVAMFLRAVDCEVKDDPFIANILIQAIEQVGPQNVVQVAETRFASNSIVLRCLVKVKEALSRMVISANWSIWRQSSSTRAAAIKAMILEHSWWDRVEYLLRFTKPILSMIRCTDMDRHCLGEVYDGIDSMIEDIKKLINEKEQDPEETFFKELQKIMVERWNKMTSPLHLLAFALSPRYYSQSVLRASSTRVAPYKDLGVGHGYKAALRRLYLDHTAYSEG